jgi:hypothetical protein
LLDSLEVYGQLGLADVKTETRDVGESVWRGYNLDNEFAWGVGAKYTFLKKEKADFGVAVQLNSYKNGVDKTSIYNYTGGSETRDTTTDIETYAISIAVGPTIDMGGWKLYGGALGQILTADYDYKECGSWLDDDGSYGNWTYKDDGDFDTTSLGGYIGAMFSIQKKYNFKIEALGTSNGWGAGAGIEIPF